ncbi:ABC transporter permease [Amycolatopsis magusensis]|uniref:ABC-2 type transport system permease protein n=1 Tax=Amycolatopsis magusensis TaxID=882444 RepID=A0ABS4PRG0_9PSEU|nr:ABC transporter permease [Amycolatopsis magusensis]MBP2182011.1 ABC-2 type transport system permease protein [Amycolatopsis magusensis]MDI5977231.1 ABC transporter permease [Amycolatopsis magusensis]
MNPITNAVRAGFARGRIELRNTLTSGEDLAGTIIPMVLLLVVMIFMRGATVPGTEFSLGSAAVPGVLGMQVVFGGMIGVAGQLMVDREDGTLLRAKATPHGMLGYLIGKITTLSATVVVSLLVILVPALLLFDGLFGGGLGAWVGFLAVLVLGMAATMPLGAVIGSLTANPRNMGLVMLPFMGLAAISGIFYPIIALPEWVQWIAQVFPMYWLGLGMRSAMLPDALVVAELGESWRHLETIGVLGVWSVAGLVLAPILLRRMARRESGSAVAARRERAMQRVGP